MGKKRKVQEPDSKIDRVTLRPSPFRLYDDLMAVKQYIIDEQGLDKDDSRFCVQYVHTLDMNVHYPTYDIPYLIFNIRESCANGLDLPACGHGGVTKGKTIETWHGTKSLPTALAILDGGGVLGNSVQTDRMVDQEEGVYHSQSFYQALTYAHPHTIRGVKIRVLFYILTNCANRVSKSSTAVITRWKCPRYWVQEMMIVSCGCLPPHIPAH